MMGPKHNSIEDSDRSSKWTTILSALDSWPRTARLCVISLVMAICSGLTGVLVYLVVRVLAGP